MYMDQVTKGTVPDDEQLERFGYRQQFVRSLRHFESFAVAFSFISITTGIFTTYGFALATGGTRAIWTWPIVIVGQALVALVYGALSVRVPLSGYSYQWASRLANVSVGWWFGWMSFAFLTIVTVSVDYGLVQVAFQPLIGETYTPTSAALETLVVLALQAALIIASTRITTRVNNTAVATEIIGIAGLTVLLLIVAAVRSMGHWSNLTSTGAVPHAGYYAWLGPFMLATLLGAYTIVGFEGAGGGRLRPFGKFELPIIAGAVIWLAYELIILIGPGEFRDAQYYVLGALGLGLVFYVVQMVTEREAMRTEPGQEFDQG